MIEVGNIVTTTEHPLSVGEVVRRSEDGMLTIEFTTPPSRSMPFGHICLEAWGVDEYGLLTVIAVDRALFGAHPPCATIAGKA